MFELIRANQRRSVVLLFVMLALMLSIGWAAGFYYTGDPFAGGVGALAALVVWGVQALAAWFSGDRLLMAASGAREIQKQDHPRLFNVVEEMTIAARLPKPPRVYVIEDMGLNAFAAGRNPEHACVAVTAGLLGRLDRDQLQGVIAHEVSHIVHRDVMFMTMAGVMLGTIILFADSVSRVMFHGRARRYRSSRRDGGGGGAQAIMMVVALALIILAPILAQLLYFACSRRREYLADAGASVLTRYPEGLASALEVIAANPQLPDAATRATAPMYIVNPLADSARAFSSWTSTHPPVDERIKILRSIAGGVSYEQYGQAWRSLGGPAGGIPASARGGQAAPQRGADKRAEAIATAATIAAATGMLGKEFQPNIPDPAGIRTARARDAGDLLRRMNQFAFIQCGCGLKLKVPPDFTHPQVKCPRCHTVHNVPQQSGP